MTTKPDTPEVPRDPRRDPRSGDVLRKRNSRNRPTERIVLNVGILFVHHRLYRQEHRPESKCTIYAWRKWAHYAEVVTVADEGGAA